MKPILILIMLLVVTSCTTDTRPTVSTPTADTTTEQVDLTDPVTQTSLGSPPFSPVNWQRFVGPFDIVGDDALPNVDQMALIDAALAELPIEVFQHPRSFVRTSAVPANLDPTRTLAVAAGPDIYLLDNVFAIDGSTSLLNLTYAVAHELAHTDQWFHLTDEYVQTVLSGDVDRVDLLEGSSLARSFASATGWAQDTDSSWTLSDEHRTASVYARTNPAEDMAESVAWASVGRSDWLDQPRRDWVEQWAGMPLDQFAADMPWSPAGSDELTAATPIYDEDAVSQFANDRSASHIEPLYFALPPIDDAEAFALQVADRLEARGMVGELNLVPDDRLPRYAGAFERSDGSVFWVEFWDFRGSELGDRPVLTYVLIRR